MMEALARFAAVAVVWIGASGGAAGQQTDPVTAAFERFRAAEPAVKRALLDDLRASVLASDDAGVRAWLALREEALAERTCAPEPPRFFDPARFAPIWRRAFVPEDDPLAERVREEMRPWDNEPRCMLVTHRYDYGRDCIVRTGGAPDPDAELYDYLLGYPPDAALLVAFLESRLDFREDLDELARFFAHAYCDRAGNCFRGVTLYDAWAARSTLGIEAPDVDAIAFARLVLGDESYASPIPAGPARRRLYEAIHDRFLEYFRHRTWIEAAANLFLNPEAALRPEHEGLRERLFDAFAASGGDPERLARSFRQAGDRDRWIERIDRLRREHPERYRRGLAWRDEANRRRWWIAEAAYAQLREYGFLTDG